MGVVKADAYGHGIEEVTRAIKPYIDYYGVAVVSEGVSLRKIDRLTPVLVFSMNHNDIDVAIRHNLTLSLSSSEDVKACIKELDRMNIQSSSSYTLNVHIAINSGMNRYGFDEDMLSDALEIIVSDSRIKVTGVYSHLYDDNILHNAVQTQRFDRCVKIVKERYKDALTHLVASGGILAGINKYDMVRMGLCMYEAVDKGFENAMTVRSYVQSIRRVSQGEYVGYSCQYRAEYDMIIAVVNGGYADGIARSMTGGKVVIKGKKAEIIGNVCMDVFFIDITDMDNVNVGDSVDIVSDTNPAKESAIHMNTIEYEVLTAFHGRCTRRYIDERRREERGQDDNPKYE